MASICQPNQILYPVNCYTNTNWQHYCMNMHQHGFLELNYILDGSCSYIIGEKTYLLKKKNLLLLHSKIPHQKQFLKNTPCSVQGIEFDFMTPDFPAVSFSAFLHEMPLLSALFKDLYTKKTPVLLIEDAHALYPAFHDILVEAALPEEERSRYLLTTLTERFLLCLCRQMKQPANTTSELIGCIKEFVQNSYYSIGSVQDIANHVSLSVPYMERIFKKNMNCTIWQYVTEERLQAARHLLVNSTVPVGEIDSLIGINSRQNFYLLFKKRFLMSPSSYRKKYQALLP